MISLRARARNRRFIRGFLLLEVMLATAIFAIAATGIALALNRLLDSNSALLNQRRVRDEIESYLAMIRQDQNLETGTKDLGKDAAGTTYSQTVEKTDFSNKDDAPLTGILKVTVVATRRGEISDQGSLLLYRPSP